MSYHIRIDPMRCKSCELCLAACPKKILVVSTVRNEAGYHVAACSDESQCTGCASCALVCPDVAIEIFKEEATR